MVMVTQYPDPVPVPALAKRPGTPPPAKVVRKVAARPIGSPATQTGAGQGRIRTGWSGSKSQGGSLPGNPRRS
jgi:hypothetical protein